MPCLLIRILLFQPFHIQLQTFLYQKLQLCAKKTGTFLQGLKDTGADPGELRQLEWIDVNKQAKTVAINHPVKGHNPRIVPVSNKFLRRLEILPKKSEKVFGCTYESLASCFYDHRKRATRKLGNPRLLKITFTTLRHWKGTMLYHKTKDILRVKKILGHKNVQTTLIYINLETGLFGKTNDEFIVRVAANTKEACQLVEAGFDYVTGEYNDGGKIFCKRK